MRRLLSLALIGTLLAPAIARAQEVVVYYHTDAIGSVRAMTDETGVLIHRYDFLPFGEAWDPPTNADTRQFAGKERDRETGLELDYFGARYHLPVVGRFTTVDPVMDLTRAPINPQRWNRYAYAGNNPMRFIDPDGENFWDFVNGVGDAVRANAAFGIGRSTGGNADFLAGQSLGDLISLAGSAIETVGGISAASGGVAACGSAIGCMVGAPAIAGGSVVASHGVGMGAAATVALMQSMGNGGGGTQTTSKTLFNKDGVRVDVENPNPTKRPGQVHLQTGNEKYIYDPTTGQFKDAPPRIQRFLEREDIQKAIEKGLRYLGLEYR